MALGAVESPLPAPRSAATPPVAPPAASAPTALPEPTPDFTSWAGEVGAAPCRVGPLGFATFFRGFGAGVTTAGAGARSGTTRASGLPPPPEPDPPPAINSAATTPARAIPPPPKTPICAARAECVESVLGGPDDPFAQEPGRVLARLAHTIDAQMGHLDAVPQPSGAVGVCVDRLPVSIALVHVPLRV